MRKFHFNLQKLLNLRTFKEDEAEIRLAKMIAAKDAIVLRLKAIAQQETQTKLIFNESKKLVSDLTTYEHYLARLHKKKELELQALAEAELHIEQARERYITAHRDRLIITKLYEKKTKDWKKDMAKQQEAMLGDMINTVRQYSIP